MRLMIEEDLKIEADVSLGATIRAAMGRRIDTLILQTLHGTVDDHVVKTEQRIADIADE